MSTTLASLLTAVRLRHPAYRQEVVPTRVLVEAAGRIQRTLAQQGTRKYSGLLRGVVPIMLDLADANTPGEVAAGSTGGLPATLDASGNLDLADGTAGRLARYDWAAATVVIADFVPNLATTTTVKQTGAGRTVNGDVGLAVWIVAGPGSGPDSVRIVASNTAEIWTVAAFATAPVAGESVVRLVQVPAISALTTGGGAATQLPATTTTAGYLVRLTAAGVPYLDLDEPLVARLRVGIPLPPHDRLVSLDIIGDPTPGTDQLGPYPWGPSHRNVPLFHQARRFTAGRVAWVQGDQMFLGGPQSAWTGVTSMELSYVPIPPLFDGEDRNVGEEYLLLPDTAYPAMVAELGAVAAGFAAGKGVATVDVAGEQERADRAVGDWLASLGQRSSSLTRMGSRNR